MYIAIYYLWEWDSLLPERLPGIQEASSLSKEFYIDMVTCLPKVQEASSLLKELRSCGDEIEELIERGVEQGESR